jgi:TRAP-type C4-dicarboxylate transport system permease small subunit
MRNALDTLYRISGFLAVVFLAAICIIVMGQVILNIINVIGGAVTGTAFGLVIPSYAEFAGFFLAAGSFFALAPTLKAGGHIRVSLVIQKMSPKTRHIAEIWSLLIASSLVAYFTYNMWMLIYESYEFGDMSTGMIPVEIWIPQVPLGVGLTILLIALVDELVVVLSGGVPSYEGIDVEEIPDKLDFMDELDAADTGDDAKAAGQQAPSRT